MRVIAHLDPWTLETHLLDRVEEVKRADPWAPVLVIVPTRRLADHVARRIAERTGAVLGVEITFHRALARQILEFAGVRPPEIASGALLEAVLGLTIEEVGEGDLHRLCRESPRSIRSVLATLQDLREAGIPPDALPNAGGYGVRTVYAAWVRRVEALLASGVADDTALVALALPHAAAFGDGRRAILHHGAYELIGVHLDLVRALDRPERPLEFLTPGEPDVAAAAYAARFARRHLLDPSAVPERPAPGPATVFGPRLSALYDEHRRFEPLPEGTLPLFSAPGPLVEVDGAARRAMAAARDGIRPSDQAIVARSLEPYAVALESLLDRNGGMWEAPVASPARANGAVRDVLAMLDAAVRDFPRAATVSLLRSPFIRWDVLTPSGRPDAGFAEVGSRRAGIVGGRTAWIEDFQRWASTPEIRDGANPEETESDRARAEERGARARAVGDAVAAVHAALRPDLRRSYAGHAQALGAFFESILEGGLPPSLRAAIDDVARLETVARDLRNVGLGDALSALERALEGMDEEHPGSRRGGVAWLDAKQARGLTFERVAVAGLNAGTFPSVPREDPFLPDEVRERLREATGRPLPVKREAIDEERLLLALTLGSARRVLEASWQHADVTGRARTASLALREIARLALGAPDGRALRAAAFAFSAHPERRWRQLDAATGLLRPLERDALDAFETADLDRSTRRIGTRRPSLEPNLAWIRAVESFAPVDPRYDGETGIPAIPHRALASTAAERLGRCPLQFFFHDVLRVRELDADPEPFSARAQDLGVDVHALLRDIYGALRDEAALRGPLEGALRRATSLLDERLRGSVPGQRASRLPVLAQFERERWRDALGTFLDRDLRALAAAGATDVDVEVARTGSIRLPDGRDLVLSARLDRIVTTPAGTVVGDYKTGGSVKERTSSAAILRADELQAPLYRELAGGDVDVEVLGVGPSHADGKEADARASLRDFVTKDLRAAWLESVAVIASLAAAGRFPLAPGNACRHCGYAAACRAGHPPTLKRREADPRLRDFLAVKRKSTQRGKTTVAAVLDPVSSPPKKGRTA